MASITSTSTTIQNTPENAEELFDMIQQCTTYVRSNQETIATMKKSHISAAAWTEHSGELRKRSVSQHENINRMNLRFFTLSPNLSIGKQSANKKLRPSALFSYYTKDPGDNKSIKPKRTFILTRDTFVKEEGSLGFSLWNENFEEDEEPKLIIELKVPAGETPEYRDSWVEHLNYTIRLCKTKELEDSMMFITDFMGFSAARHCVENVLETLDAKEKLEKNLSVLKKFVGLHENFNNDRHSVHSNSNNAATGIESVRNKIRVSKKVSRFSVVSSDSRTNSSDKRRCSLMTENMIRLSDVTLNNLMAEDDDTKKNVEEGDSSRISKYAKSIKKKGDASPLRKNKGGGRAKARVKLIKKNETSDF
jgi:hypothetical protein